MATRASAPQVVIAGGSVAGLATALSLKQAGCKVQVFERAASTIPAGAGLALDDKTIEIMTLLTSEEAVEQATFKIPGDGKLETVVDREIEEVPKLQDRDTSLIPTRSAQWASIHQLLKNSLPEGMLRYSHTVSGFELEGQNGLTVSVEDKSSSEGTPKQLQVQADLLIGADGCLTTVGRQLAADKMAMRYAGYCAWRGVLEGDRFPDAAKRLHTIFPGAMFHVLQADSCHILIFKLPGNRFNWIWYTNQPQPKTDKPSPTVQPSPEQVKDLHARADEMFPGPVAELVKTTEKPFISIIFDREPLQQIVWDRVALVGEAAHPTTPHAGRSTNMSIADAHSVGQAVQQNKDLQTALETYQQDRLGQTTKEVLFSRCIGLA
ncbi:hypothetical protein WJX73_005860 [Symbiochloris irregularis]|uniref:FAD-binding domain-containing protein n=1 Tax=Symbiochloris irregularis TaxID=706552 RepID=A0AAW1P964_9CHLO